MNLKEFITETVSAIVDATSELQEDYEGSGALVNPPVSFRERDILEEGSSENRFRTVQTVEFDVAVTASSNKDAGGKFGLKVLSIEAGVDGNASSQKEQVSRVRFSIPIALTPSAEEKSNSEKYRRERDQQQAAIQSSFQSNRGGIV